MTEFFPPAGAELDLDDYIKRSRMRAAAAIEQLGWGGWRAPESSRALEDLFPIVRQYGARPLQKLVETLKQEITEPSLVLIEAPMGEGKTEAAMALADNWAATCQQRGCYFALPTMATSNQMFGRVRKFLEHRCSENFQQINLLLLHGRASLSEALRELLEADRHLQPAGLVDDEGNVMGQRSGDVEASVFASEWFMFRKRGLLAPFGVGTIDQALMAVLRTKHVFVRLFGLAQKTIIIDEVHAYDAYMNELLLLLLRWLRSLGSSVVLLSATLPASTRRQLLAAYQQAEPEDIDWSESDKACYPRLSWIADGSVHARQFDACKAVAVRLVRRADDVAVWGPELNEALRLGGCAAVICNTVAHAQNTWRALLQWFGNSELDLFHARFPFDEREQREARTLNQFGPADNPRLRPRRVLVATQVIEQSLDLDFDLMLTQLAPVDLVLQRAGRLHRHTQIGTSRRERPDGYEEPTLWLLEPALNEDDTPDFGASGFVYDQHVLLRSWLVLTGQVDLPPIGTRCEPRMGNSISMPGQIEPLIEAIYNKADCPGDLSAAIQRQWKETRRKSEQQTQESVVAAEQCLIKPPRNRHEGTLSSIVDPQGLLEEDAPDIHQAFQALTRRQTRPSVSIVCLFDSPEGPRLDVDGPLANLDNPAPATQEVEQFIRRSVSVSKWAVTDALREVPQIPRAWNRVALLRSLHVVYFDPESREADVGGQRIQLHPQLGIVFPEQLDEEL